MIRFASLVVIVGACGGGAKKVEEPPPVAEMKSNDEAAATPPTATAEAPAAAAKDLGAKAALQPVKGAKQPPGTVTFTQSAANGSTSVTSDFEGLRAGRYHLVIHEGTECGESGAKAGDAWKGAENVKLSFVVGGDEAGNLDESSVALKLDGAAPIVGQTLALHDDKKGQPGKMLACGTIDAVGQ